MLSHYIPPDKDSIQDEDKVDGKEDDNEENEEQNNDNKPKE